MIGDLVRGAQWGTVAAWAAIAVPVVVGVATGRAQWRRLRRADRREQAAGVAIWPLQLAGRRYRIRTGPGQPLSNVVVSFRIGAESMRIAFPPVLPPDHDQDYYVDEPVNEWIDRRLGRGTEEWLRGVSLLIEFTDHWKKRWRVGNQTTLTRVSRWRRS
jgi:hypothetical protein